MNQKFNKIVAKASAAAMIASMLLPITAARAAAVVNVSDTMSAADGEHVHTVAALEVTHTISMELTDVATDGEVVTVVDGAASPIDYTTGAAGASTGACEVINITPTATGYTFEVDDGVGCVDGADIAFTLTSVSNAAATVGSHTHTITSDDDEITGAYAIAISAGDQITVTASIDPSITFEVYDEDAGTVCANTPSADDFTIPLGTLTTGSVRTSGDNSTGVGAEAICTILNTNATNGAVVTVKSNSPSSGEVGGAGSLGSTSVPADFIPADADVDVGVSGWGICVNFLSSTDTTPDSTLVTDGDWGLAGHDGSEAAVEATADCDDDSHETSTLLDDSSQPIMNTGADGVGNGLSRILVKAAISGTQPAHSDYTATLTFVATGTF